jgi:hypothetical protein
MMRRSTHRAARRPPFVAPLPCLTLVLASQA